MDIKHNAEWFGKLEMQGIQKHEEYEGTIQSMLAKMLAHLIGATPRLSASGHKEIVFRFDLKPFSDEGKPLTPDQELNQLMSQLFPDVVPMTQEEFQAQQDYDAIHRPYMKDDQFILFQTYQINAKRNSEAAPGEIRELQRVLSERYGHLPGFADKIIDRKGS